MEIKKKRRPSETREAWIKRLVPHRSPDTTAAIKEMLEEEYEQGQKDALESMAEIYGAGYTEPIFMEYDD